MASSIHTAIPFQSKMITYIKMMVPLITRNYTIQI